MELKKIITSKDYFREYLEYKGSIYSKEYLQNKEPDHALEIEHFSALIKNADPKLTANYTVEMKLYPMPSLHKMVELLEKKRSDIYEQLNIHKITGQNAKIKQALALYTYLSSNIQYDMTMQEYYLLKAEQEYNEAEDAASSKYQSISAAIRSLENTLNYDNVKDYYSLKLQRDHLEAQAKDIINEIKQEQLNYSNKMHIKTIFTTLIFNKGVCYNYSVAYQYLLEGLGIKCYTIATENHTINALEIEKDNKKEFIIADLTLSLNLGKEYYEAFAIPQKFLEEEMLKDKKIEEIISINSIKNYQTQEILDANKEDDAIKNLKDNITKQEFMDEKKFVYVTYYKKNIKNKQTEEELLK